MGRMRAMRCAARRSHVPVAPARRRSSSAETRPALVTHHHFGTVDVHAPLGPQEEDPIHAPIIEDYRRRHGLPLEGDSPGEAPLGPSDAEIKYRLNVPPVSSVVYVSFQNAMPPDAPDHSQSNPGPAGSTADRAGYTRVRVQKSASIAWEFEAPDASGRIPVYAQSVNVFYRLDPIEVYVSSDYAENSCPYRVTLHHERSHVEAFARIFHAARATLVSQLAGLSVPTEHAPMPVPPADVEAFQNNIGTQLRAIVNAHSRDLVNGMEADRNAKDSPAAYSLVYGQCPASDW